MIGRKLVLPKTAADLLNPQRQQDVTDALGLLTAFQNMRMVISSASGYSSSAIQISGGAALLSGIANTNNPKVTLTWTSTTKPAVAVPWSTGNSVGTMTLQDTTLTAGGTGFASYAGDQWLLRSSRNGAFIAGTASASSSFGGQQLTIPPFTFSDFPIATQLSSTWFSTNGGTVATYVSFFGVFTVFNLYCSDLFPGTYYTVSTTMTSENIGGGGLSTAQDSFTFQADDEQMTITRTVEIPPNGYAPSGVTIAWQNVTPSAPQIKVGH